MCASQFHDLQSARNCLFKRLSLFYVDTNQQPRTLARIVGVTSYHAMDHRTVLGEHDCGTHVYIVISTWRKWKERLVTTQKRRSFVARSPCSRDLLRTKALFTLVVPPAAQFPHIGDRGLLNRTCSRVLDMPLTLVYSPGRTIDRAPPSVLPVSMPNTQPGNRGPMHPDPCRLAACNLFRSPHIGHWRYLEVVQQ
jgi:hypothetical protein